MGEYVEGTMEASLNTFNQCTIVLLNMPTDHLGVKHSCRTVAAPFCSIGYISDADCVIENNTRLQLLSSCQPFGTTSFPETLNKQLLSLISPASKLPLPLQMCTLLLEKEFRRLQP